MTKAEEQAAHLVPAAKALLLMWTAPRGSLKERHTDYPSSFNAEGEMMRSLQDGGMFVIDTREDPVHGRMECYYVSDYGREVAAAIRQHQTSVD